MMSELSVNDRLSRLTHSFGAGLVRQLSAKQKSEALTMALEHLTPKERELIALRFGVGQSSKMLARIFKYQSTRALELRVDAIMRMLEAYFLYFAQFDHHETKTVIRDFFGPGAPRLLEIFCGKREIYGGVKMKDTSVITNIHVRAFAETLIKVSGFKRL